jgi:hypothetical protein
MQGSVGGRIQWLLIKKKNIRFQKEVRLQRFLRQVLHQSHFQSPRGFQVQLLDVQREVKSQREVRCKKEVLFQRAAKLQDMSLQEGFTRLKNNPRYPVWSKNISLYPVLSTLRNQTSLTSLPRQT